MGEHMKFFDDKNKVVTKWNRNYFYLGTILIIAICVILAWQVGFSWHFNLFDSTAQYSGSTVNFLNILSPLFSALDHSSWEHVRGNIISFAIMGIYLERKLGTFKFLSLCLVFMFFSPAYGSHMMAGIGHLGMSGVNYSLYAFVFVDFIFSFKQQRKNPTSLIFGIIAIIYAYVFSMSYAGTGFINVTYYPKNFIEHAGHFSGFVAGILVGLFYQLTKRTKDTKN